MASALQAVAKEPSSTVRRAELVSVKTRQNIVSTAVAFPLAVAALIAGCGSSAPDGRGTPTTPQVSEAPVIWHINGAINDNHGHKVTLNWGQIETGETVSLPLFGNRDHSHRATLSPDELSRIADGDAVVTTSSRGAEHDHIVMFSWTENVDHGPP